MLFNHLKPFESWDPFWVWALANINKDGRLLPQWRCYREVLAYKKSRTCIQRDRMDIVGHSNTQKARALLSWCLYRTTTGIHPLCFCVIFSFKCNAFNDFFTQCNSSLLLLLLPILMPMPFFKSRLTMVAGVISMRDTFEYQFFLTKFH